MIRIMTIDGIKSPITWSNSVMDDDSSQGALLSVHHIVPATLGAEDVTSSVIFDECMKQ